MKFNIFIRELDRFFDKYEVQPDPQDTEAVDAYWKEVANALVAWNMKWSKDQYYLLYERLMMDAFVTLEDLFKLKEQKK